MMKVMKEMRVKELRVKKDGCCAQRSREGGWDWKSGEKKNVDG